MMLAVKAALLASVTGFAFAFAPLPTWGYCGIYLPQNGLLWRIADSICIDCQQLERLLPDPNRGVKCRSDCFTSDHFLMCAREKFGSDLASNFTNRLREMDAWWHTQGKHMPEHKTYVQKYLLV